MADRLVPAGRVGRPHGLDGSFYLEDPGHPLRAGTMVSVAGQEARVERCGGTAERPLLRLSVASDRDGAAALRGERLLLPEAEAPLADGEWLVEDLVRCEVPGLGRVRRVIAGPSCDVLEVGEAGTLVPLVADAVKGVDLERGVIEVDLEFLALEPGPEDEPT